VLAYPTAIDQALGYRRVVDLDGLRVKTFYPAAQRDLASFCNGWMKNIKDQQGDLAPKEATAA
jgi:hypothetical protein